MATFKDNLKWFVIKTNLFKHTFNVEGFVYTDTFENPVNYITKSIRWLGTVKVKCRYKNIAKKATETFSNMFPRFRGYIKIL